MEVYRKNIFWYRIQIKRKDPRLTHLKHPEWEDIENGALYREDRKVHAYNKLALLNRDARRVNSPFKYKVLKVHMVCKYYNTN